MKEILEIIMNVFFTVGVLGTGLSLLLFIISIIIDKRYMKNIVKSFSVSIIIVWIIYIGSTITLLFI